MATILKPLDSGLYTKGRGVIHFFPFSDPSDPNSWSKGIRVGDCDAFSVQVEVTESERYSNEHDIKTLVLTPIDEIKATVTVTAAQMSEFMRAAAVLGTQTTLDQTAETGLTLSISEPGVYKLGGFGAVNVLVDKSGEVAVLGTDYLIDAASGLFEALTGGLEVTYDLPAVSGTFATGIASGTGIRGKMIYRGVNAQGVKVYLELHDVELRPTGANGYISDDIWTTELSGTARPVSSQPHPIGFERDL